MMLRKLLEDRELGMNFFFIDRKRMRNVYTSKQNELYNIKDPRLNLTR
jgi:hypothetical protein